MFRAERRIALKPEPNQFDHSSERKQASAHAQIRSSELASHWGWKRINPIARTANQAAADTPRHVAASEIHGPESETERSGYRGSERPNQNYAAAAH
jgi:hypothetical protein